nr:MAG TPA: hypothetical protein [Caudoviricetes sp.]
MCLLISFYSASYQFCSTAKYFKYFASFNIHILGKILYMVY